MNSSQEAFKQKIKFKSRSEMMFKNCVIPLLRAMKWQGSDRDYAEALPHFIHNLNLAQLHDVLEKVNYQRTRIAKVALNQIDSRTIPCLVIFRKTKHPAVLLEEKSGLLTFFDGYSNQVKVIKKSNDLVDLYVYKPLSKFDREVSKRKNSTWFGGMLTKYKSLFIQAIILSFFYNLLLMFIPIYVMNVYDKVIGVGSFSMLRDFMGGILLVLAGIAVFQRLRSRVLAYIGAQVDKDVGNAIFSKLMYLSPQFTESASVESQVSRIKDFDNIREFFTTSLLTTCMDIPFVLIYLLAIYFLVGNLAFIPVVMVGIFSLIALINNKRLQERSALSSFHSSERQEFLLEALDNIRLLKQTSALSTWENRYRDLSAQASYRSAAVSFTMNTNNSISDLLMMLSGLSVMAFGVFSVFSGDATPGALVGAMILIWRALTPIRAFFVNLPRVKQFKNSVQSLERLMAIAEEVDPSITTRSESIKIAGDIKFEQVSFRYPNTLSPALVNINLHIKPGEILMIMGPNGSGKTSLLKLINNLFQPQAGMVALDDSDIRQINPILLRHSIGYCPQSSDLFYGTIAQNIRLADPTISDKRIYLACQLAGIEEEVRNLDHGIYAPIRDQSDMRYPSSFLKGLCLARAYVRNTKIFLLDEPGSGLDAAGDKYLMEALGRMKGKKTVVMITHRPSHLKIADKVIVLRNGQIAMQGKPEEILKNLDKVYS